MNDVQVKQAFQMDEYIKKLSVTINRNFLEIARTLLVVNENKLYKHLGYDTFTEYIAQPELGFRKASVYKLMGIYRTYVDELRVSPDRLIPIEWTKLSATVPVVNEDNKEELLQKAETLSRSDLSAEIKLIKDPKHKEDITKKCPTCNGTGKIPLDGE